MRTKSLIVIFLSHLFSCELEDPDQGILIDDIITIEFDDTYLKANGNDRTVVTATLQKMADANQSITFTTDQGSFAGTDGESEITVTSSGKVAEVILISDEVPNEQIAVSAKVGDFTAVDFIEFEVVPLEDFIRISIADSAIPANGNDRTVITAIVQEKPNQQVTFVTDQGTFAGSDGKSEITVKAAGTTAQATLISNQTPSSHVTISATVDGYTTTGFIEFEAVPLEDIIAISFGSTSLLSNGNDRTIVTATLVQSANQPVSFVTDQGTFAGTNGKSEVTITASGSTAEVILISDETPKDQVTVSAKVGDYMVAGFVSFLVDTEEVDINQIIQLNIPQSSLAADGNSRISITGILGEASQPNQVITFSTDQGYFAGTDSENTIAIKAAGRSVEVFLVSDTQINNSVTVSAQVGEFKISEIVSFQPALPDDLVLVADKVSVKSDGTDKILLTINLYKDSGSPSDGTRVDFTQTIEGADNAQEVQIQNIGFVSDGTLTIPVFSRSDSTGRVRIRAEVADKIEVRDEIVIEVVQ